MGEVAIVVVSGSLRSASTNTVVAQQLVASAPGDVRAELLDITAVPLFDQDVEDAGDPESVTVIKGAVREADGLVLVTPEYNYGVPAVTKNAVDWLSRPFGDGPVKGTAVGIVSASPSRRGGIGAREHLSDTMRVLTDRLFEETLGLPQIDSLLDGPTLTDDGAALVLPWFERFCAFVRGSSA
jgi:chromate reductase